MKRLAGRISCSPSSVDGDALTAGGDVSPTNGAAFQSPSTLIVSENQAYAYIIDSLSIRCLVLPELEDLSNH